MIKINNPDSSNQQWNSSGINSFGHEPAASQIILQKHHNDWSSGIISGWSNAIRRHVEKTDKYVLLYVKLCNLKITF